MAMAAAVVAAKKRIDHNNAKYAYDDEEFENDHMTPEEGFSKMLKSMKEGLAAAEEDKSPKKEAWGEGENGEDGDGHAGKIDVPSIPIPLKLSYQPLMYKILQLKPNPILHSWPHLCQLRRQRGGGADEGGRGPRHLLRL